MTWLVPLLLGLALFGLGQHQSGAAAGAFLGLLGVAIGWSVGKLVRGRAVRNAPAPPERRDGERPLLHGPLSLLQAGQAARPVWAYLSDQRLSLLPQDGGEGVDLPLKDVEEIRPGRKDWRGGLLTLVVAGKTWKLRVPDVERWISTLREASR